MLDLQPPEQLFQGFRIATMAPQQNALANSAEAGSDFKAPDIGYGLLEECSVGVAKGEIVWIVPDADLPAFAGSVEKVEGQGRLLTPGLVDCHTHLVFGGNRADEWESRLNGVSYEEIARRGGGILSSVKATRAASLEELVRHSTPRLERLMQEGVTTVEIKSGYGLDLESEIKILEAARALGEKFDVSIATTLLAAHAVPPEFKGNADGYIELVCKEIIPAAKDLCSAVDAFCESIAFDVDQTRKVFDAAMENGLDVKVHAEQLTHTGMAVVAAKMGALSADHLEYLTAADCEELGAYEMVATVLPGAYYCLNETQKPPIEALRKHRVPIAVATDCNPGSSPVTSLLLMANMACNLFGLTPEESLAAITIQAAKALGLEHQVGSLQPGLFADFAVWDVDSPAQLIYGVGHNPCRQVYRRGQLVK